MVCGVTDDKWTGNDMGDGETYELVQKKLVRWLGEDGEEHCIECDRAYTAWQCRELNLWNRDHYPFDDMVIHDDMIWEVHGKGETVCWVKRNARICIDHFGKYERWTVVKEVWCETEADVLSKQF